MSVSVGRPLLGYGDGTAEVTTLHLPPGALLLLYTDGLVERREFDVDEALAQLWPLGAQARTSAPDDFVDRVLEACGGLGDDDTTVLAVRLR